jgi:hypothetical protein
MKTNLLVNFTFAISLLFIVSCSNNKTNNANTNKAIDDVEVDKIEDIISNTPMPSSYEIIQLLNKTGASYIYDVTNPSSNVDKYISFKQKSINLGIYGADLIYTITYKKKDATAMYLDNFVQLVGDLEITTLGQKFFEQVQNNLDNEDSLLVIIEQAQNSTQKFLQETGKTEIAIYALTGSFVEGLYLVGVATKFSENKDELFNIIIQHKKSLNELLSLMTKYKDKDDFKNIYSSLSEIKVLLNKIDKNKDDVKSINQLKDKIIEFRESLIS